MRVIKIVALRISLIKLLVILFAAVIVISGLVWMVIYPNRIQTETYIPHEPILIKYDSNFTDYGFPGNGTAEDPFIIEGYYINSSLDAIRILDTTRYFEIRNCKLESVRREIYIRYIAPYTCKIFNNILVNGIIYIDHCKGITIESNVLSNAISLDSCSFSNINNNTITNSLWGIALWESNYCIARNNTVTAERTVEHRIGISSGGQGNRIEYNTIRNMYFGLYVGYLDVTCAFNLISDCYSGIETTGYASGFNISNNEISNCDYTGISLYKSWDSLCINNYIKNASIGIRLDSCRLDTLANNTIIQNEVGIEVKDGMLGTISYINTQNITIKFNQILNSTSYGIKNGYRCRYSQIYLNTFMFNNIYGTSQAYDDGFFSQWYNDDLIGNFWNNGTLDEYSIDGDSNSTDSYPLAYPPI